MSKKKRRKVKQRKPKKIDTNLNDLAWAMARVMTKMPPREHQNETVIDRSGKRGCIPFGTNTGYQWCSDCFYSAHNGCMKMKSPPQWTINDDGTLTRRY